MLLNKQIYTFGINGVEKVGVATVELHAVFEAIAVSIPLFQNAVVIGFHDIRGGVGRQNREAAFEEMDVG